MTTVTQFPRRGIGRRGEQQLMHDVLEMERLERLSNADLVDEAIRDLEPKPLIMELIRRVYPQALKEQGSDMTKKNFARLTRLLLHLVPRRKRAWFAGWFTVTFRRFRHG